MTSATKTSWADRGAIFRSVIGSVRKPSAATIRADLRALPSAEDVVGTCATSDLRAFCSDAGLSADIMTRGNPKTLKGLGVHVSTAVLHLAPHTLSGHNVCPHADGCEVPCLNTAGRGGIFKVGESTNAIQECRIRRTRAFFRDRPLFLVVLALDILRHARHAASLGMRAAVRLNGTSDLRFDRLASDVFALFPRVQFYDYTKDPNKVLDYAHGVTPKNYHVTFSRSAGNGAAVDNALRLGVNVAVVFDTARGQALPATWRGVPVIDADRHDGRFLDTGPAGYMGPVVAGLRAKGRGRTDRSGFVVPAPQ